MEFRMDGNLEGNEAVAADKSGLQVQPFFVPQERPPEWATVIYLSPEGYGAYIRFMADRQAGRKRTGPF